jgi:outer membrane lipopolysaccharide assembly protein LptE/RlpB
MMKRLIPSTLFIIALTLLAACGNDQRAKGLVKDFMKNDMAVADYDVVTWSALDSTFRINDSTLSAMRQRAVADKLVKQQPAYTNATNKLLRITLKYAVNEKDTQQTTFYLDDKVTGIVGVKQN